MSYDLEKGLKLLRDMVASASAETQQKFELQIWRLQENIRTADQFGSSESIRSDRARIVDELNKLSLEYLKSSFTDLCMGKLQSDDFRLNTESLRAQSFEGSSTKEEEQTPSSTANKQSRSKIDTSQEDSKFSKDDKPQKSTAENFMNWLKRNKFIAWLIIFGVIVVAIGNFTDSISKIENFFGRWKTQTAATSYSPNNGIIKTAEELRRKFRSLTENRKPPLPLDDFDIVSDIINALKQIDVNNGHALYYSGEVKRWTDRKEESHQDFYQYLEFEKTLPRKYREGERIVQICYERADGYCRQRTGWIHHKLANDFYNKGLSDIEVDNKLYHFRLSLEHVMSTLVFYPDGFEQPVATLVLKKRLEQKTNSIIGK